MRMSFAACLFGLVVGCTGVVDSQNGGGGDDDTNTGVDAGGGSQTDAAPIAQPKLAATLDKSTVATAIGETVTLSVVLTGSDGFEGAVTLTPTVTDAGGTAITGWTMTQTPTATTLTKNGTATVQIAVMIPSDTASLAANVNVAITATGVTVAPLTSAFTVANTFTVHIKAGTGTGATNHNDIFPQLLKLKTGATLIFQNDDTIVHRIHADGGFAHEPNDLQPGSQYKVVPTGNATFYCHDHDPGDQERRNNVALQ